MKVLFESRGFWLALLTIMVMLAGLVIPGYELDVEHGAGLAVIVGGYLVAYAMNPTGDGLFGMLTSRKFWVGIIGFAVLVADSFHVFPAPLDITALIGFVLVITFYMFALAKDPGSGWRGLIISRKFWAAIIGLVLTFMQAFKAELPAGLTAEQMLSMVVLICGYIAGIGVAGPPTELPDPVIPEEPDKMLKRG
jgi:uncharacterized membrane protein